MGDLLSPEIPAALSRLNEHARAHGCGKRAIYAYKTFLACAFATEARPLRLGVKCNGCDGTGLYWNYDPNWKTPCRRCTNGIATLQFVESRIGDFRWHHPWSGSGSDVLDCVWGIRERRYPRDSADTILVLDDGSERTLTWKSPEGWGPNMPGAQQLAVDDTAALLNTIEAWLPHAHPERHRAVWPWRRAMDEIARYRLDLERVEEEACWRCGATSMRGRVAKYLGYMTFARPICATCYAGPTESIWPTEPHPASLTPNVLTWLAHPERQGPFKAREHRDDW